MRPILSSSSLLFALALGACASASPDSTEGQEHHGSQGDQQLHAPATLEAVNRTDVPLRVRVRGRAEGVVAPQGRLRIYHLAPGAARIEARPVDRGVSMEPIVEDVVLGRRQRDVWDLVVPGQERPFPPALTDLVVVNETDKDFVVSTDHTLGRVFAGAERRFRDLAVGTYAVSAQADGTEITLTDQLRLAEGADTRWALRFEGAPLVVVNGTGEKVEIAIDGEVRAAVEPDERWESHTEQPGVHVISAVTDSSGRRYELRVELVPGRVTRWAVAQETSRIIVDNTTGEALRAQLEGQEEELTIPAGGTHEFARVSPGEHRISAWGERSKNVYAADISVFPGQTYTWRPVVTEGTLRIINRTRVPLELYIQEQWQRTIAPSAIVLVGRLPAENFTAEAIDQSGHTRYAQSMDRTQVMAATWVITPKTGDVRVVNRRPESVEIGISGRRLGTVGANETRTFSGLSVGPRRLDGTGAISGRPIGVDVEILEDATAEAVFEDPTAALIIDNESVEALTVMGLLSGQRSTIKRDQEVHFRVPVGVKEYVVIGADTGSVHRLRVDAAPGGEVRWLVETRPASLLVWNKLTESVAITVDKLAVGTVDAGKSQSFGDISPGRHTIQSVGLETGRVRNIKRVLSAEKETPWTLDRKPARLILDNRSAERLDVLVDGRPYGAVEPRSSRIFAGIWPGAHEITALGERSGRRHGWNTSLADGQDELLIARAPIGTLVIENRSKQDVRVLVDGQSQGIIRADAPPTQVPVAAGKRQIAVERLVDHTVSDFQLDVYADHAIHLPIFRAVARLVVVNHTETDLTIRLGAKTLATLEPGQALVFDDLDAGRVHLTARTAQGDVTHSETKTLHPGGTASWALR